MASCHDDCHAGGSPRRSKRWRRRAAVEVAGDELTVALAGNPNVGKSTLFNVLTGGSADTANYPGTTVGVATGTLRKEDGRVRVMDLPGAYALSGSTINDQALGRRHLIDASPDRVVVVADASNLERNLYLVLQVLDLGLPTFVALNLMDQAAHNGLTVDDVGLSRSLRVPIFPTIASRGVGTSQLAEAIVGETPRPRTPRYGREVEAAVAAVEAALPAGSTRSDALLLLENDPDTAERYPDAAVVAGVRASELGDEGGVPRIVAERHRMAARLAAGFQRVRGEPPQDRMWKAATHLVWGPVLLLVTLIGLVAFLFLIGNGLATLLTNAWAAVVSPLIRAPIHGLFGTGAVAKTLLWGFDAGIIAALSVGIPFVLTVYFLLAMLEDSGYLNAAAFVADRMMTRLGLHGRAVIPLFAGFGCSVPAVISTRILSTKRERTIANMLITLIPCSARTAVIAGAVARFVGWGPALGVFVADLVVVAVVGRGLDQVLPGKSAGLAMEIFPFRRPILRHVWRKTWRRFRLFVVVATPIVIVGSLILGALYESGLIWELTRPMSPVIVGLLRLPPVAGLALLFAVLRKELALQLLVTLAIVKYGDNGRDLLHFMTGPQIVTYALVNTIYVPCIATIAVLKAELGTRRMLTITAGSISIALLVGGIAARVLPAVM